jgi:hypothetical protein
MLILFAFLFLSLSSYSRSPRPSLLALPLLVTLFVVFACSCDARTGVNSFTCCSNGPKGTKLRSQSQLLIHYICGKPCESVTSRGRSNSCCTRCYHRRQGWSSRRLCRLFSSPTQTGPNHMMRNKYKYIRILCLWISNLE